MKAFPKSLLNLFQRIRNLFHPENPTGKAEDVSENRGVASTPSYANFLRDVAELSEELFEMDDEEDAALHDAIQYILDRLDRVLERNGARPIEGEPCYSALRHKPIPPTRIADGSPIGVTLRRGWEFDGKVLRRARVTVQSDGGHKRQS